MLHIPSWFPERYALQRRRREMSDRQREFESRFARSFAEMRARKQPA